MIKIKYKDGYDGVFPLSGALNVNSHDAAYTIFKFSLNYRAYTDLT